MAAYSSQCSSVCPVAEEDVWGALGWGWARYSVTLSLCHGFACPMGGEGFVVGRRTAGRDEAGYAGARSWRRKECGVGEGFGLGACWGALQQPTSRLLCWRVSVKSNDNR